MVKFEDVGNRLQTALRSKGYNKLLVFAVELDVNPSTVTRWCNGHPIKLKNLVQICKILDISLDWLIFGEEYEETYAAHHQGNGHKKEITDALQGLSGETLSILAAAVKALRAVP